MGCAESEPPPLAVPQTSPAAAAVVPYTPPTDGTPPRVFFAGDSLAAGFNATTPENAFPVLVASGLGGTVDSEQDAAPGQTLITVSESSEIPARLDLAVIELGTNDFGKTPVADFRSAYVSLVSRIRESSPDAALVCLGVWGAAGGDYDLSIKSSCEREGGVFNSLAAVYVPEQYRGPVGVPGFTGPSDDFHPNDLGHRIIAGTVLAAVPRG
ncbi:hypothetical protein GCM10007304_48790 [Rhodococcoides trifolii]|uniref:SGNH hydrolase-type esterase domain-containing protein n=1 Tax=Rhodococcoides trifolii TaxID=908250 RepID=A0A917LIN6_9NOCA|nr:hypothetical protein GCM10007304_48790 [Rhodococcus trifolii]